MFLTDVKFCCPIWIFTV